MVTSAKGGAGKTSIAMGLVSVAHHKKGLKTLVLDSDVQTATEMYLKDIPEIENAFVPASDLPKAMLGDLSGHDVVIFDLPPRHEHEDEFVEAAAHADFVLIPFDCLVSVESSRGLIRKLTQAGLTNWACVHTMASPAVFSRSRTASVRKALVDAGIPCMESKISSRTVWKNQLWDHAGTPKTLIHSSGNGAAIHEIEKLYAEIAMKIEEQKS